MIKSENGIVTVNATEEEVMSDLVTAIAVIYEKFCEIEGEETAKQTMERIFKRGLMSEEEIKKERERVTKRFQEAIVEKLGGVEL